MQSFTILSVSIIACDYFPFSKRSFYARKYLQTMMVIISVEQMQVVLVRVCTIYNKDFANSRSLCSANLYVWTSAKIHCSLQNADVSFWKLCSKCEVFHPGDILKQKFRRFAVSLSTNQITFTVYWPKWK